MATLFLEMENCVKVRGYYLTATDRTTFKATAFIQAIDEAEAIEEFKFRIRKQLRGNNNPITMTCEGERIVNL